MYSFAGGRGISASALPASRRFLAALSSFILIGLPALLYAGQTPLIGPELLLDQPVPGPSPCTRSAPAVAVNYSGYLVAWTHGKSDATFPGIYAARIDPLGNLLDPFGFLVSASAAEQSTCKVAALPDGFLVVWSAPHGSSSSDWDILAARVSWDGTVLDSTPLPVCTVSGVQSSPAVAANGDNYLVVWTDSRSTGIYGSIVTPDGGLHPTNGFPICTAAYEQYTPAVASVGANYLVVWQDYRHSTASVYASDIYGARVSGSGVLLDTNGISICRHANSQYEPAVAGNGTNYLVVWEDYDPAGNDVLGARIGADGKVWDTNALVVAHGPNAAFNPVVAANFNDFLVVWQDYRQSPGTNYIGSIFATRVRNDGTVAYSNGIALSGVSADQCSPAVAGFWDDFLVVWQDDRNNPRDTMTDIYGAGVDSRGSLAAYSEGEISLSANAQLTPQAAFSGTQFLAVWADNRNAATNGWDILGVRLDQKGAFLDTNAVPISTASQHQTEPCAASQGANYLVVWTDQRNSPGSTTGTDIYGAMVDLAGAVSSPGAFPICRATNDQSHAVVTTLGTNYLVVWQDARGSLSNAVRWDIYGGRVTPGGQVLDADGFVICTNVYNQTMPSVRGNAAQALVIWADARSGAGTDIYGARVGADGTLLDTNALPICTALGVQSAPAVTSDGSTFFVAWTDTRGSTSADIYAAHVSPAGVVTPTNGFAARAASGQQLAPTVAFNGLDYIVAWHEARSSLSNSFDIFAAGVTPEGQLFNSGPLFVNTNAFNQLSPLAAAGADGRFLILNQGFQFMAQRAVANFVNLEAIPRLDTGGVTGDGQYQFRLRCAPEESYSLETSEDLLQWSPFASLVSTNYSIWFADPAAANRLRRFYRASLLP